MRDKIVSHLEENGILCNNQHGFRKGRSCLSQLLHHIDQVLRNLLNGHDTDSIYLDFAKAFDKVNHRLLLKKVWAYGIRGKVYSWIEVSSLTDPKSWPSTGYTLSLPSSSVEFPKEQCSDLSFILMIFGSVSPTLALRALLTTLSSLKVYPVWMIQPSSNET